MSYTSINGVPTSGTLSSNDTAALKAYITAQQAAGGRLYGVTDPGQIASILNAPVLVPNPAPNTVLATAMPKSDVLAFLAEQIQAAIAGGSADATLLQMLEAAQTSVADNALDPIPTANIEAVVAEIKTATGTDLTTAVAAAMTVPVAGWSSTVAQGVWPLWALSVPTYVTAADVSAAVAS
jgi:hypothetical protein